MRQVHVKAGVPQRIDRPIPAVGRFDRDRRTRAGFRHLAHQRSPVVVDPHTLDLTTTIVDPRDHRTAQMQIDAHELPSNSDTVTHGGLPS